MCTRPDNGYRLSGAGVLERCADPNCRVCTSSGNTCQQCNGAIPAGGQCIAIVCGITGCAHFDSLRVCNTAAYGFHLQSNGIPVLRSVNLCDTCPNSIDTCTGCYSGATLNAAGTVCERDSATTTTAGPATSTAAPTTTPTTTTTPAPTRGPCRVNNCQTCTAASAVLCAVCDKDYRLNDNQYYERECRVANCASRTSDSTKCRVCSSPYHLNSNGLCVYSTQGAPKRSADDHRHRPHRHSLRPCHCSLRHSNADPPPS